MIYRRSSRLLLRYNVRMKADMATSSLKESPPGIISGASMYDVYIRLSFRRCAARMDVQPSEILSKLDCLFDGQIRKVLISEHQKLALSRV